MRNLCVIAKFIAAGALGCALLAPASALSATQKAAQGAAPVSVRGDFQASGLVVPSVNGADERPLLAAGGFSLGLGLELRAGQWIPIRSQTTYFSTGHSAVDESLFLYRGFYGLRWAALTGYGFRLGRCELDLLGGGAISATKYDGTALVSAYYSLIVDPRLLIPVKVKAIPGFSITASLPLEYMWRGTTRSFAAGLGAGVSIPIGKAAEK
jgi:hypothetical protein